jgi:hypothetical protein
VKHLIAAALMIGVMPAVGIAQDKKPIEKQAPDPNKRVCRSEMVTGSQFPKRTCHTRAEWTQIDRENGSATSELMRRSSAP